MVHSQPGARPQDALGGLRDGLNEALARLDRQEALRGLADKRASLWSGDERVRAAVFNRLGWVDAPEWAAVQADAVARFAEQVRRRGDAHVFLLGMGGSSLAPEVLWRSLGHREGFPSLAVLDTTDPVTIKSAVASVDLSRALFVVASKSGTTVETLSQLCYCWERVVERVGKRDAGGRFIAITDEGSYLQRLGEERRFLTVFLNPADVGGRFSALTYFGLVPGALVGVDVAALVERGRQMRHACLDGERAKDSPAARLAAAMYAGLRQGRDKLTLVASPGLESFGDWLEQLIAESTGKQGAGIVPVVGEPLAAPPYGNDRLFVSLSMAGAPSSQMDSTLAALETAGHPVLHLTLRDPLDIGAEFYRWEAATALAGVLMGINPFDEPNVQESKDKTKAVLEAAKPRGVLPAERPLVAREGIALYADEVLSQRLVSGAPRLEDALRRFVRLVQPGDYVAVTAYLPYLDSVRERLQELRVRLRGQTRAATTLGFGPRFLHSTGQLHKGGPSTGLFLQITADDAADLSVPGEWYTFGTLKRAQAIGDVQALRAHGRRAVSVHISGNMEDGLRRLTEMMTG